MCVCEKYVCVLKYIHTVHLAPSGSWKCAPWLHGFGLNMFKPSMRIHVHTCLLHTRNVQTWPRQSPPSASQPGSKETSPNFFLKALKTGRWRELTNLAKKNKTEIWWLWFVELWWTVYLLVEIDSVCILYTLYVHMHNYWLISRSVSVTSTQNNIVAQSYCEICGYETLNHS